MSDHSHDVRLVQCWNCNTVFTSEDEGYTRRGEVELCGSCAAEETPDDPAPAVHPAPSVDRPGSLAESFAELQMLGNLMMFEARALGAASRAILRDGGFEMLVRDVLHEEAP